MRIAIFGTGAVGGYFGGRLAQTGEDVVFLARGKHLRALREHGLTVQSTLGDFAVQPVTADDDPASIGPVDLILVCVKAWQVPEAATALQPMLGPDTFVVPLQNGIEAPDQLASVIGRSHVLGGLCGIVAHVAGPGHICHMAGDPMIKFGELDNRNTERVESLKQAFERASGLNVEIPLNIQVAMWQKFLLIAPWSGIGSITRASIGVIRSQQGTRKMLEQAISEIYELALAKNSPLPKGSKKDVMDLLDSLADGATSSMQRDIMNGLPSELEAQIGAVVRLGREVGVSTDINAFIYHSLLPMEMQVRGKSS